jgi:hypothetical protein
LWHGASLRLAAFSYRLSALSWIAARAAGYFTTDTEAQRKTEEGLVQLDEARVIP